MYIEKGRAKNLIYTIMETKICKKCNVNKNLSDFRKRKSGIFSPTCKKCYRDTWYSKRPEYQSEYDKKRWAEKKDIEKSRNKKWRTENWKKYHDDRMSNDDMYRATLKIRWCVKSTFKKNGYTKNSKTYKILGITYEEFKAYIESKFENGMTWKNHGEWHLDHIIPVSQANSEEELIKLNHYSNFQPLWAYDNLSKGKSLLK